MKLVWDRDKAVGESGNKYHIWFDHTSYAYLRVDLIGGKRTGAADNSDKRISVLRQKAQEIEDETCKNGGKYENQN